MNTLRNNNKHRYLSTVAYSAGRVGLALAFVLSITGGVALAAPLAATAPGLGSAASFAVLAGTAVTCTDSTVAGDVGAGTAFTQTNCPVSGTIHKGDAAAKAAYADFLSAYAALASVPCDQTLTGTLAGVTLAPGVYCFDAAATLTGVLTLNGPANGIWIFKIGTSGTGALTGTNFSVVMAGGGVPCNVTWWVAQAATLTDSNFVGTILAGADMTITRGTFAGDAFAGGTGTVAVPTGAVTMTGTKLVGCEGGKGNGHGGQPCNQGCGCEGGKVNGHEGCGCDGGKDNGHGGQNCNQGGGNGCEGRGCEGCKDNGHGGQHCNQGVGNGREGCDPGNSNQGNPNRSNDENGGRPGDPGRQGGDGK